MLKTLPSLCAFAVAALVALPVRAETDASTVVAVVNGEEITLGHVVVAYASLPQQYQQLPANVLYGAIIDQLVQQTALRQAHGDDEPRHVRLSLENERRSLLAAEEVENVMRHAVTDEGVQALYDEKYADAPGGTEYNASHILVETEEAAQAIKAELDAGADFAATAKAKSTGPSGPNGGALGWFGAGAMVQPFQEAVTELEVGEISAPVETQFGWHVILLTDKRIKAAPKLDEVRAEIEGEVRQRAVEERIEELTSGGEIERVEIEGLDPEVIRDLTLVRE